MRRNPLSRREFLAATATTAAGAAMGAKPSRGSAPTRPVPRAGDGKPAILGGTPIRSEPFPSWPVIGEEDEKNFLDSLRKKEWCRLYGNITTSFEQKWASLLGAKHSTGVVNGTNAIYAALYALEVGPGDEVIVPSYTFSLLSTQ